MAQTKKNIIDSILLILYKFKITDEAKVNENWLGYKIDQVAAELKIRQYVATQVIDPTWLCQPFILNFHKTNYADNQSINDSCTISKTTLPQLIDLPSKSGNLDLGIYRLSSMKNRTQYTYRRSFQWQYTPPESTYSLFKYYDRVGQSLFINDDASKLMLTAMLLHPEDGYLNNTNTVASGSLVNGTSYRVLYGQIIYNNAPIGPNETFTANATTTYTGTGSVYLASQVSSFTDTDPYPASGEMIRQIELEILTKEFNIEKQQIADVRNDSIDDANKVPTV